MLITIKEILSSNTWTTWSFQLATILRFVLILPLVLTTLDEDDIQIWLLFNSLFFLSNLLISRIGSSFTQAIAFSVKQNNNATINLDSDQRILNNKYNQKDIYNTCKKVVNYFSIIVAFIFFGLCFFIIEDKQASYRLYIPEIIIVTLTIFLSCKFSYFSVLLNGNNKISTTNNIGATVSLVSVLGSFIVLLITDNFMFLILAYFIPNLIGVILNFHYASKYYKKKINCQLTGFNQDVFKDLLKPISFGLIISFADQALLHIVTICQYKHLSSSEFSSFLLTTRIISSFSQFSFSILTSQRAYYAILIGLGKKELAIKKYIVRSLLSLFIFCLCLNFTYFFSTDVLIFINARTYLLEETALALLFSFSMLNYAINCTGNFTTICNHIIFVKRSLFSLVLIITLVSLINFNLYLLIAILYLPRIVFINFNFIKYLVIPSLSFKFIFILYSAVIFPFLIIYIINYL